MVIQEREVQQVNVEAEAPSGGGLGKFENSVTRAGSAGWSRVGDNVRDARTECVRLFQAV